MTFERFDRPLEWAQTVMGVSAAILVASNLGAEYIFFAMLLFTFKDTLMLYWTQKKQLYGLLVNSIGFMCVNIYGLYNWWPSA